MTGATAHSSLIETSFDHWRLRAARLRQSKRRSRAGRTVEHLLELEQREHGRLVHATHGRNDPENRRHVGRRAPSAGTITVIVSVGLNEPAGPINGAVTDRYSFSPNRRPSATSRPAARDENVGADVGDSRQPIQRTTLGEHARTMTGRVRRTDRLRCGPTPSRVARRSRARTPQNVSLTVGKTARSRCLHYCGLGTRDQDSVLGRDEHRNTAGKHS